MEHDQIPLMSVIASVITEAGKPKQLELAAFGRSLDALTSLVKDFSEAGFAFGNITEDGDMLTTRGTMPCEDGEDGRQVSREITAWWKQYCETHSGSGDGEPAVHA